MLVDASLAPQVPRPADNKCRMSNVQPPRVPVLPTLDGADIWRKGKRTCALDQPRSASGPSPRPGGGRRCGPVLRPFCGAAAQRPQNGPANTLFRACRRPPPPIMVANNGYSPCVNFNSSMFAAANLLQPLQAHRAEVLALTCRMGPPAKQGCAGVDS